MIAIYARQSVDKKDSISIETQIETCKNKLSAPDTYDTEEVKVFSDKGFSGKNTERPKFKEMMDTVREGGISKIIVYKLDRISRSLIDFLNMREEFKKYKAEFISCAEDFDTSTGAGKLMLNMLMMFAEMEREAIQKRITDNYYARGEKGLYLGGYAPFGYEKVKINADGKKTYTFKENNAESISLNEMYRRYLSGESLNAVAKWLNITDTPTRKGKAWSSTCVARILRSPVYVKANADVYNYLLSLGANMNNPVDDYIGKNGCMVYGKVSNRTGSKFKDLSTDFVTLGLHEGIVEPSLWLTVQYTLNQKENHSNLGTGSLTWLQGLIKCGCGYTYYIKRCDNGKQKYKYLYCRGRRNGSCPYPRKMIQVERVEEIVEVELLSYLSGLKDIGEEKIETDSPEVNLLKIELAKIDDNINNLISRAMESSELTTQYLNQKIEEQHKKRQSVVEQISKKQLKVNRAVETGVDIDSVINNWNGYDFNTKKAIAKKVIENVILEGEEITLILF